MDCVVSERPLNEKGVASFINYCSVYRSGKFDFDFSLCYLSYIVWTVWNGLNNTITMTRLINSLNLDDDACDDMKIANV